MSDPQTVATSTSSDVSAHSTRYRVVIAAILFITLLVAYLDRVNVSILNADPTFQKDMGIVGKPAQMGLLMTVFLLAYGIGNILLAPVANRMGPRRAMLVAVGLWFLSTLAGGFLGSAAAAFGLMLMLRVILGIGEAMHWPMQSVYVTNWFPLRERGRANAAWLVALMVGPMIGTPLIAGLLKSNHWTTSFYVLAGISLIPLALIGFLAPDKPSASRFANDAERRYISEGSVAPSAQVESSNDRSYLKSSQFWMLVVAYLAASSIFWGLMTWLPTYLRVARKFSWTNMGYLASLPYALATITVLVFGIIVDRRERKAVFSVVALAGESILILAAALVPSNLGSALLIALAFAFHGSGMSGYWTIMQGVVTHGTVASASGIMNGISMIGSAFIPTIFGLLIGSGGHYTNGLIFLVVIGLIGMACMAGLMARGK